jgi:hypothetical protein
MKRVGFFLLGVFASTAFSAHSQCEVGGYKEVDCVSKTVLQEHLNDEFYLHIRCLPDHRHTTDDYILTKDKGQWKAEYRSKGIVVSNSVGNTTNSGMAETKVLKMEESDMDTFLKTIDINRLVQGGKIDSLSLDDSLLDLGMDNYAIMICSKGTFRLHEYPFVLHNEFTRKQKKTQSDYWKSTYLDNLIARFTQALNIKK